MKYGIFVPRNDHEADNSPERLRWDSGRQLEWMRLRDQGTFERNWDWARFQKKFQKYKKCDIGHMFFVYDFKHSGEHSVRLVFDGSRQNPDTYTETYMLQQPVENLFACSISMQLKKDGILRSMLYRRRS
jgi:hypothetical protein